MVQNKGGGSRLVHSLSEGGCRPQRRMLVKSKPWGKKKVLGPDGRALKNGHGKEGPSRLSRNRK